jgi:RNA polymerase sigma factor (sigma-70 family)
MECYAQLVASMHGPLIRMARAKLRNPDWAYDAVADTLLAALERPPSFDDPARIRAWLFGVLKHKLVDQLRRELSDAAVEPGADAYLHDAGDADSCALSDPMRRTADAQFMLALNGLLDHLPPAQARAFLMRDCLGLETPRICAELGATPGHVLVMLHRARHKLRQGLAAYV